MVGGPQLLIILLVVLLLFGGKKLPELARSLGTAKREFDSGIAEGGGLEAGEAPKPASDATPIAPVSDAKPAEPTADA
jgi:sec-independent protein translocase protein TatA